MTIAASGHARDFLRMFSGNARGLGTGKRHYGEHTSEQGEYE
jgi:hypothetical protein